MLTRWVIPAALLACMITQNASAQTAIEIHYAPAERLDRIDAQLISTANSSIDIAAYVLSDWGVIDALNAAAARGVVVRVVLDPREHSDTGRMVGLDVRTKHLGPLMHLKSYEVDGAVLRDGSENFSHSAPTQDNSLIIIRDVALARKFDADFEHMWAAAQ